MGERLLLEPHVGVEIIWVVSMDSWPSQSAMTDAAVHAPSQHLHRGRMPAMSLET